MKIFAVKLLFEYIVEKENRKIYEESIRIFHAESSDEAFEKAQKSAKNASFEYTNIYSKKVTYKFYNSIEAFLVYDEIEFEDGAEIFSTTFEMKNPSDDPIKTRYKSCSVEDMYILRNAEYN